MDLSDEEGKIPIDVTSGSVEEDEDILQDAIEASKTGKKASEVILQKKRRKRTSILDLMEHNLVKEGDHWKLDFKGEVFWGRVTGNGEIEVNGVSYPTPSSAVSAVTNRSRNGWVYWMYRTSLQEWVPIEDLKEEYLKQHNLERLRRKKAS